MKNQQFAVTKFMGLLLAGSFTVLASYIVRLSDSLIAGNLLGESAFAGVNLAGPFLSFISFIGGLVATGMATNYSQALGRCDQRRARQFFMQGLWSIFLFGGALAAVIGWGHSWLVAGFGAEGPAADCANQYLGTVWPVAVLEGLVTMLVSLGYADGDTPVCVLGHTVIFIGNFVASVVAVKLGMGVAGCAFGSVIAESLGVLVLSVHFLRKRNTFRPVAHFSLRDTWRIAAASFGDAAAFLCDGLLFFFLNRFAISSFGSGILPVVAVVTSLWGLLEIFNGVGVALQPIVTVYYGERNYRPIRTVLNAAMLVSVAEGLAFGLVGWICPESIVTLVGVTDPELVRLSVSAIHALSFGFVALALAGLFNSYYMFIDKAMLAGVVTFLCYLLMPIVGVAVGALYTVRGLFWGLALGPVMGVAITAAAILALTGMRNFPSLLTNVGEDLVHVFNLKLVPGEIVRVSRLIGEIPGVPMSAALLAEEVFMVVCERAKGRRLHGEVTVDLRDGVQMTLRDDGEIFDITDADQHISSLRTFLVASMMTMRMNKLNLATTGFNRNVFRFDR